MNYEQMHDELMQVTIDGMAGGLKKFMPDCAYCDYYTWGLSQTEDNLNYWLKLNGIEQLVRLTTRLLGHSIDESEWPDVIRYSVPMNVYQIFEIVSDNLAIGMVHPTRDIEKHRRDILLRFNHAMIDRLSGDITPVMLRFSGLEKQFASISTFEQSLSPERHRTLAQIYLDANSDATLHDIEYGMLPILAANIESCNELSRFVASFQVGDIVRGGLIRRYQAVNDLINGVPKALDEWVTTSADTILVLPTIGYYIGVLCEKVTYQPNLPRIIESGLLENALFGASVLVRLLNDMGRLVIMSEDERDELMKALFAFAETCPHNTISELMVGASDRFGAALTRVQKDAYYGEFNMALNGFDNLPPTPANMAQLANSIEQLCTLYCDHKLRLRAQLDEIAAVMGNDLISDLTGHFVYFHEIMYGQFHTDSVGEYAV